MTTKNQTAAEDISNAPAVKANTAISTDVVNFEDDIGGGFEDADVDSFAVPFLRILQKGSPQCDETKAEYDEEAKPGQYINSATLERYDGKTDGVPVIPCHFKRSFIEWKTRENGGGFVAEHDVAEGVKLLQTCQRDMKNRDILPNGNQLVDTRTHFVLIVNEDVGVAMPAVVSMQSTQTKKSKAWMTGMQNLLKQRADGSMYNPAMFASIFRLRTVAESNDQGSWYGYRITHDRYIDPANPAEAVMYKQARKFRDDIRAGAATVKHDDVEGGVAGEAASEDIPF